YVYDQLNRIYSAGYSSVDASTGGLTGLPDYHSKYSYDADGNIKSLVRYGQHSGLGAAQMDTLIYQYTTGGADNKLRKLYDYSSDATANTLHQDISGAVRYQYDEIGNTTQDLVSAQDTIAWNLYNKVTRTVNTADTSELRFSY